MTVKQASVIFGISEKEVRKRNRDNMILNSYKEGRVIVIPESTRIIPSKKSIRAFLIQILKFKNNSSIVISHSLWNDNNSLLILSDYLFKMGLIDRCEDFKDHNDFFRNVKLTDDGISFALNNNVFSCYINNLFNFSEINFIKIG